MSRRISQTIVTTVFVSLACVLPGTGVTLPADEPVVSSDPVVGTASPEEASPQVSTVVVVLPARAMEDIFAEQEAQTGTRTRWIAVNARAMSVDHEPADGFEKEAARRIAAGDREVEQTDKGVYRYAAAIPLHQNCIQCHMGTFMNPPRKPRFAGLVFRTPVRPD